MRNQIQSARRRSNIKQLVSVEQKARLVHLRCGRQVAERGRRQKMWDWLPPKCGKQTCPQRTDWKCRTHGSLGPRRRPLHLAPFASILFDGIHPWPGRARLRDARPDRARRPEPQHSLISGPHRRHRGRGRRLLRPAWRIEVLSSIVASHSDRACPRVRRSCPDKVAAPRDSEADKCP